MLIVHFVAWGFYRIVCRVWEVLRSVNPSDLD